METTAVDRVLIEAGNLVDSGQTRFNLGGKLICWCCGHPAHVHDPYCVLGRLIRAVKEYERTPRFLLSLSPTASLRLEFEATHPDPNTEKALPLAEVDDLLAHSEANGGLDHDLVAKLYNHIAWQQAEIERYAGSVAFRDEVYSLLTVMRSAGGDAVGTALYLYRKNSNQRPAGSDQYASLVEGVVASLRKIWFLLGGDPKASS